MHISNIFCNFAADFDIGIHNDLITYRFMTKKTIYKVSAGNSLYRLEQQRTPEGRCVYVVYNRRKLVGLPFAYDDWMSAVGRVNSIAGKELFDLMRKDEKI